MANRQQEIWQEHALSIRAEVDAEYRSRLEECLSSIEALKQENAELCKKISALEEERFEVLALMTDLQEQADEVIDCAHQAAEPHHAASDAQKTEEAHAKERLKQIKEILRNLADTL